MENNSARRNFFLRQVQKLSLEVLLLIALFIICLWLLFTIADMVFKDKNTAFDEHIFTLIHPYINNSNTSLMQFITFFGSPYFLLPANILLAGVFFALKNHRLYSIKIVAISLTSTAVLFLLKTLLQRERPSLPVISSVHGYSFPSGHSFSSLVFFGMISYIVYQTIKNKWVKWIIIISCSCFTLLIGFSRIYLKLHFASDVIAGFCLGIIWLLLAKWLLVKAEKIATDN